jgi:hypothetical protein
MSKRLDFTGSNIDELTKAECKNYKDKSNQRRTTVNQSSQSSVECDFEMETTQLENPIQTNISNFISANFGNQSPSNSSMISNSNISSPVQNDL